MYKDINLLIIPFIFDQKLSMRLARALARTIASTVKIDDANETTPSQTFYLSTFDKSFETQVPHTVLLLRIQHKNSEDQIQEAEMEYL